jgi:hypothetical protein
MLTIKSPPSLQKIADPMQDYQKETRCELDDRWSAVVLAEVARWRISMA